MPDASETPVQLIRLVAFPSQISSTAQPPMLHRWLFWLSAATTLTTLGLVSVGGLVTSKGVGMSVPDWPTSYGYNMFLFPPSQWVGGIFDEHVHRLLASAVGWLTFCLAVGLQWRGPSRLVRRLGWGAFGLVVFQGVLGGLRVVLDRYAIAGTSLGTVFGVAHACTGQSFFVLLSCITLLLSRYWNLAMRALQEEDRFPVGHWLRWGIPVGTGLILAQLTLGACMRHQHAGLAIYDFPLAYGQWWPSTDAESLLRYNQVRPDENSVTAFQIGLQMFHRVGAFWTLGWIGMCGWSGARVFSGSSIPRWGGWIWVFMLVIQASLGIATVVFNKPADIATSHVAVGAASLAWGTILSLGARRLLPAEKRAMGSARVWASATSAAS